TDANGNHLWNHTYGGTQPAVGWVVSEVVKCAEGGFAIFGTGPDSNPANNSDYYLVRIDETGDLLWNYTYDSGWMDSPANNGGLVQCDDGGFAIVGYRREVEWRPYYSQVWLVRTDADGKHVWDRTYGDPDAAEFPIDILRVGSDFLIGVWTVVPNTSSWMGVIRIDAEGNMVSDRRYDKGFEMGGMVQCSNGGFAIAGGASLIRTDDNGVSFWEQTYNQSSRDELWSIVECSDGGFAMAGITEVDWEAGDFDFWLLRVADPGPPPPPVEIPIEWIVIGIGLPVVFIAIVAILRTKRK
ncbi:MAG: hypothetical protein ACFFBL_13530, partial [Promethearchaeota archaeon]